MNWQDKNKEGTLESLKKELDFKENQLQEVRVEALGVEKKNLKAYKINRILYNMKIEHDDWIFDNTLSKNQKIELEKLKEKRK